MKSMIRAALIVIVLVIVPVAEAAQPGNHKSSSSEPNTIAAEGLPGGSIASELDIPYAGTRNPMQRLDLFLPKDHRAVKLPVIVFFHGGGWMSGDKADGAQRLTPFVRTGQYAGVSVNYRLSREAKWPAQLDDIKAAIRWVRENATKYGFDPDHIGVWGPSAGGHLALMLGVTGDVPERVESGSRRDMSSKVAAVANFFGVTDMPALLLEPCETDHSGADAPEALLIGGPIGENTEKAKSASPTTFVTAGDPPVLTVHGDADPKVPYDQAVLLDAALREAGVPRYFVTVKGGGHGDFGTAADDRVKAFFDRYLRGETVRISTETITDW